MNDDRLLKDELCPECENSGNTTGEIICKERLDGMLKFYHRKAA